MLGRARRRTLIVDAGQQSNLDAHGIGGLLGSDGRPPAELYAAGRVELSAYPSVEVRDGEVVTAARDGDEFALTLGTGERRPGAGCCSPRACSTGRRHCPGSHELWGGSVFHCPFCHGWEVRDQPLAVLAAGQRGVHSALLLRGWSDDIVLLTDGPSELGEDDRARLAAAGVPVDERPVAEVRSAAGQLTAVVFADGSELPRRGMLVGTTLHQRSTLAEQLGVELRRARTRRGRRGTRRPLRPHHGTRSLRGRRRQRPDAAGGCRGGGRCPGGCGDHARANGLKRGRFGLPLPTGGETRVGTR